MRDELPDGTILQDGLKLRDRGPDPAKNVRHIPYPVKGIILDVYETDLVPNRDGETTVCDIYVQSIGVVLFKVPFLLDKASADNYVHYGPVANTGNVDGAPFNKGRIDPRVSNGDSVLVVFVDADVHQPVIVKMIPQPQSGFDGVSPEPREGVDAGDHYKVRMNGMNFRMDKDGNVRFWDTKALDPNIPAKKKVTFELQAEGDQQKVEVEFDNTGGGKVALRAVKSDGKKQEVVMDAAGNSIVTTNETPSGTNKITMQDQLVQIDVVGKCIINTSDNTEVNAQKNVQVNATEDIVANAKNIQATAQQAATVNAQTATVTAPTTTINAATGVTVNTPLMNVSGLISCAGIGAGAPPVANEANIAGSMKAQNVESQTEVKDAVGTMSTMRSQYNGHTHSDPQGGSVGPPSPAMS